jgi:hypothetical protein
MRVGLVGCVKSKQAGAAPARELYTSPLFRGRRAWVERSCDSWFILSAKHGLVEPDRVLSPYDETLTDLPRAARRAWSVGVLQALKQALGDVSGVVIELHAGSAYLNHGLVAGLRERGAVLERPVQGLSLGQQLAFYKQAQR